MEPAPFWPGVGLLVSVLKVPVVLATVRLGLSWEPVRREEELLPLHSSSASSLTRCMVAGGRRTVLL